jgi:hypothetical protein
MNRLMLIIGGLCLLIPLSGCLYHDPAEYGAYGAYAGPYYSYAVAGPVPVYATFDPFYTNDPYVAYRSSRLVIPYGLDPSPVDHGFVSYASPWYVATGIHVYGQIDHRDTYRRPHRVHFPKRIDRYDRHPHAGRSSDIRPRYDRSARQHGISRKQRGPSQTSHRHLIERSERRQTGRAHLGSGERHDSGQRISSGQRHVPSTRPRHEITPQQRQRLSNVERSRAAPRYQGAPEREPATHKIIRGLVDREAQRRDRRSDATFRCRGGRC